MRTNIGIDDDLLIKVAEADGVNHLAEVSDLVVVRWS